MTSHRNALLAKLSEILESEIQPTTALDANGLWDSLAVVLTVAAIDDVCQREVDGVALSKCETVEEVLALAGLGA